MIIRKTWLIAAALGAAASWRAAGRISTAQVPPQGLRYVTACAIIDSNSADGYVTNQSQDTYLVNGQVRFTFSSDNSMSRPDVVTPASSIIQAGQSVRVVRVKLPFLPLPGETCHFDVSQTLRKA